MNVEKHSFFRLQFQKPMLTKARKSLAISVMIAYLVQDHVVIAVKRDCVVNLMGSKNGQERLDDFKTMVCSAALILNIWCQVRKCRTNFNASCNMFFI